MRTALSILLVGALAGCTNAPVAPSALPIGSDALDSQGGVTTLVTGSAHRLAGGEPRTVAFNAKRLADGTAEGEAQINVHAADVWWHTRIECVTVVGNRAFLGGTITAASDARVTVGTKSYFWVEDHGEGGNAPPDVVSLAGVNETQQGLDDFCNLVQNLLPGSDVLRGNVQIR